MRFSKQEYWNGLPCPPLGDLPNPGIKPMSLKSSVLASKFFNTAAKSLQSCSTLCDPIDGRPPGSPIPGILQASTTKYKSKIYGNIFNEIDVPLKKITSHICGQTMLITGMRWSSMEINNKNIIKCGA